MSQAAQGTSPAAVVAVVIAAYHVAAIIKDAEAVAANWRRYNSQPTMNNFIRLLLAEGVFIADLGLGE